MDRAEFIAEGHKIITDGLANAHRVAALHPNLPLTALALSVEHTMRAFFNHLMDMTDGEQPVDAANAQRAAPEPDDVDAQVDAELAASAKAAAEALAEADPPKDPTIKVQG